MKLERLKYLLTQCEDKNQVERLLNNNKIPYYKINPKSIYKGLKVPKDKKLYLKLDKQTCLLYNSFTDNFTVNINLNVDGLKEYKGVLEV